MHICEGSWDLTSKMEEILSLVKQMQNVGNLEPRIDDLVSRINKLQQAKKILSEELSEANEHSESLQRELEKLNAEKSNLEEIWNEKKEARKIMQLHCEETEAEMYRKQKLSMELKQRIEELTAEIQEEKLKQRQQRLQFETLLDELTEKHKSLGELHAREKSVIGMRESKECWLSEEKLIQGKLADVQDKFDLLSQSAFSEERKFLKSQEAASALELFKEENQKAKEYLETVSKYNSDLHQKCGRLKTELEDLEGQDDFIKED
ncbi:synaptonemal complex central element protein 1-like isoform X3 [Hemicordylus capensis]|uniref:synaptonemal complex central element protein 1-like isoform X3 n=1 Tax=Hemicordylus capensis TaxID=884348 RepID=UPI002303F117|nr:synaptonemal complex central element protein 1-like isoform X3 [Hemicordylus capensis]